MFYKISKIVLRMLYKILFRMSIEGNENIPKQGGAILCANHSSNFDPVTMGIYSSRAVHYMAKKELFQNPFMRCLLTALYAFPVDRSTADMTAFKNAVKLLKQGHIIGMFAQGTRVKEGEEKAAKAGVALFATKANVPVVPVAISGSCKPFSKMKIVYGKPLYFEEYRQKRLNTESLNEITNKIMNEINHMKAEV